MKIFLVLLGSTLVAACTASGQTIGVYSDALGTNCNLTIPYPGGAVTAYVVATTNGSVANGLTGTTFRVSGLPSGWTATVIATDPDANVVIGDVFADGVAVGYPVCTTTTAGRRVLLTLSITPSSLVENVSLTVLPHQPFWACGFETSGCIEGPCPNLCGCGDMPIPCWCVEGVPTTINGPPCVVATQRETWERVKSLYRN